MPIGIMLIYMDQIIIKTDYALFQILSRISILLGQDICRNSELGD